MKKLNLRLDEMDNNSNIVDPCPICLDQYKTPSRGIKNGQAECALKPCFHSLCFRCLLNTFVHSSQQCPICKGTIVAIYIFFDPACVLPVEGLRSLISPFRHGIFRGQKHLVNARTREILPNANIVYRRFSKTLMHSLRKKVYVDFKPTKSLIYSVRTVRPPSSFAKLAFLEKKKISKFVSRELETLTGSTDTEILVDYILTLLNRFSVNSADFAKYIEKIFGNRKYSILFSKELETFLRFRCERIQEFDEVLLARYFLSKYCSKKNFVDLTKTAIII
ncbi:hypothetical protein MHBO_000297 [Bonamia ostreae]|uniref:RING-type domain-containing protein n=1 Tax=Bonamia ostreae TaxID=126728 RepID=A0ABV2AF58_9EUKA